MKIKSRMLLVTISDELIEVSNDFIVMADINLAIFKNEDGDTTIELHGYGLTSVKFLGKNLLLSDSNDDFIEVRFNQLTEMFGRLGLDINAIIKDSVKTLLFHTYYSELLTMYP